MKTITSGLICIVSFGLIAQNKFENILSGERTRTEKISPENTRTSTLLPSNFALHDVAELKASLDELTIVKVYYVYTAYKKSPTFNQNALDIQRLYQLSTIIPKITSDPYIEWEIIEQLGCTDYTMGQEFFHGFVLIHRPIVTENERTMELELMNAFLKNPKGEFKIESLDILKLDPSENIELDSKEVEILNQKANFQKGNYALYDYLRLNMFNEKISSNRDDVWVYVEITLDSVGKFSNLDFKKECKDYIKDEVKLTFKDMPDWSPEMKNGLPVESKVNLEIRVSYNRDVNGIYTIDGQRPSFSKKDMDAKRLEDLDLSNDEIEKLISLESSPIYKSLELLDSEKIALVMDVTASMNSKLAGLNWWIFNNEDTLRLTSYTFFNDGDKQSNNKKKVGFTGGFYQTNLIGQVASTIMEAMYAGSGGDSEENDMEAVLFALTSDTQCEAALLIADNCSEVRDMSLLNGVNKKIHVLVCANPNVVRVEYLDIAKRTGGDLIVNGIRYKLDSLKIGDQYAVGKATYRLTITGFKHISTTS